MNVAVFFAFPSGLDPGGVTVENNKFSIGTAPEVQTIEKDGKVTKQISHKQGGEGNALSALCLS